MQENEASFQKAVQKQLKPLFREGFEKQRISRALTLSLPFLYDEFIGRLAQRLERSVYTRKVVRSNRTVPTILLNPFGSSLTGIQ